MLYSYFVEKLIRQSFDHVNNHRWDDLLKAVGAEYPSPLCRCPLDWW